MPKHAAFVGALVAGSISVLVASALPPPGTAPQVAALVKASTSIKRLPGKLTPPLTSFTSTAADYQQSGVSMFQKCDPYYNASQVAKPTPCFFGDTAAKKTIVFVGDSNVGNWLPALNRGMKTSGYRLAVLAYSGCPTPDLTYTAATAGSVYQPCNTWHHAEPEAVAALHPVAVIAASGAVDLNAVPSATWVNGMARLFNALTYINPSARRILMGTSPYFRAAVPLCLAGESNPQRCGMAYKIGVPYYGAFIGRDPTIATASKATLIPTYNWVCTPLRCSPIIGNYLAYTDVDHLTTAYSDYLATVATAALLKAVTG